MLTQSETIGKIVEALSKAQGQFEPIIKDVKAHHHKYAPLDACFKSTRKHLNENGLIVTQTMDVLDDGKSVVVTTLGHVSGEFFRSYTDLSQHVLSAKGPNPLHSWGSVVTYTRRYAYLLIIGAIGEDEDSDGGDVQHRIDGSSSRLEPKQKQEPQVDPLISQLLNLIKSSRCDVEEFTKFYGISSRDLVGVKKSIDNFDELLINFKDSTVKKRSITEDVMLNKNVNVEEDHEEKQDL